MGRKTGRFRNGTLLFYNARIASTIGTLVKFILDNIFIVAIVVFPAARCCGRP
jgi:hypothetical protein